MYLIISTQSRCSKNYTKNHPRLE